MKRNLFVQIAILVVLSSAIAVVANGFASRTRRLVLPGYYPNALRVPPKEPARVPPPARTETAVEAPVTTIVVPVTATIATTSTQPVEVTTTTATTTVPRARPEKRVEARPAIDLAKFQPHPDRASVDISGEEAAALHKAGALFLDARRTSVYEAGHIAGARSFSVWESDIDDKVNALFEERPDPADQNKPIVIYCSGGACEDSHMLAQKLWGIQFNNLYVYKDGFPDWQQRGGAVKTGSNP
ncbi:MAG TPA: rhodanese-like domain-containing protein [Thermoanaerobaculia bacterium]|jgi:rhodanese-related sulfurtransferase|nr:rhodanese-like domain-containing protein [Thermoanaerobaculia bacterium]